MTMYERLEYLSRVFGPWPMEQSEPAVRVVSIDRPLELKKNQVITIPGAPRIQRLEVQTGVVWLTETPHQGDVILRAAKRFSPTKKGALVIQAMEEARVVVFREG